MQPERSHFGTGHQSASRSTGQTASSSNDAGNGKFKGGSVGAGRGGAGANKC